MRMEGSKRIACGKISRRGSAVDGCRKFGLGARIISEALRPRVKEARARSQQGVA